MSMLDNERRVVTYPWGCTIAEEGRYPLKTSPTEVFLINDSWMMKQMVTPRTKAITNISNALSPFIDPFGL